MDVVRSVIGMWPGVSVVVFGVEEGNGNVNVTRCSLGLAELRSWHRRALIRLHFFYSSRRILFPVDMLALTNSISGYLIE